MGFKRPFEEEEFLDLPFRHSRHLDHSNKTTRFDEVVHLPSVPQKPAFADCFYGTVEYQVNHCNSQGGESSDDKTFGEELNFVGPGFGMSSCTWVTKGSDEEYSTRSSRSQRYIELDIPPRVFAPVGDEHISLWNQPPRKQVPLGPDHQADIPEWEGDGKDKDLDGSGNLIQNNVANGDREKLTGTCIIPLPASSIPVQHDVKVGEGRKQCVCLDRGSVRCVRHHIKEAREELIKMLGYEKFKNLGFCEMGEDVVRNWSGVDEQLFHEVVYSNPVSMGRNFWKHLAAAFPSRTKGEIVSYYFNVFVLRRRATQNRSWMLDIDSDDDEWCGGYESSFGNRYVGEDDEDSDVESPLHQETERVYHLRHEEDDDEDESDSDYEAYVDAGHCEMNYKVKAMDKFPGSTVDGGLSLEDDSCTSFEHPLKVGDSNGHTDESGLEDNQENKKKKLNGCGDRESEAYLLEQCDAKVWDARFHNVTKSGTELLPTLSIIEEIFGDRTWDKKARDK